MKRVFFTFIIVFGLLPLTLASATRRAATFPPVPTASLPVEQDSGAAGQVAAAIQEALHEQSEYTLGLLVNEVAIDSLKVSPQQSWATALLVLSDPVTGEVLPAEPGLVLARRDGEQWQAILPGDAGWLKALGEAPSDLLPESVKEAWLDMYAEYQESTKIGPFGGYLLPWAAGQTVWLSQSLAHDKYIASGSAHYAFDFYVSGKMFNLHAARAGRVWLARWDVPNNDNSGVGNYLVLEDTSTSPVTYQLYLHLAKDSIPPALRQRGAYVMQGQYIGMADNTGQSSGHHLHFQVHTNASSYWGTSVDITFDDVPINGGRPRVDGKYYSDKPYCRPDDVCAQFQSAYISGNTVRSDALPPAGDLLAPQTGATISTPKVTIQGWAQDADSGLEGARLLAKYAGAWKEIGSQFSTSPFSFDWDMCADGVPDGPVSLALKIWDRSGNQATGLPGLAHFTKAYACPEPPPPCTPGENQVALFAGVNFSGACVVRGIGDYATGAALGLGGAKPVSLQAGANVLATLYTGENYTGRGETFTGDDSNLSDNLLGANTASSLRIRSKATTPAAPGTLVAPAAGTAFGQGESISLAWRAPLGATKFQVKLETPSGLVYSPVLKDLYWNLSSLALPPGSYKWWVKSFNDHGASDWSLTSTTFSITVGTASPASTLVAPYADDMESGASGWTSSGLWSLAQDAGRAHSPVTRWYYGTASEIYADGKPNSGSLTSPAVLLPETGANYLLRFWYRYQTEGPGRHWDQRWVQISQDGGPFEDLLQLHDDLPDTWLNASVDLSSFAGKTIRVRFYFATLDPILNGFEGWHIDDFEILQMASPDCADGNDTPAGATPLAFGETRQAAICPSGDVDFNTFEVVAGDRILVSAEALGAAPPDLSLRLSLLDSDGASVLAEQIGQTPGNGDRPALSFLATRSGRLYLKVRAWSHPASGGPQYGYSLRVFKDNQPPKAMFTRPSTGDYLQNGPITLTVAASDEQTSAPGYQAGGIQRVEFLWHSGNWAEDDWVLLGSDTDPAGGWTYPFDLAQIPYQQDMAFYANVYDWAGNWMGAGAWKVSKYLGEIYIPLVLRAR